MNVLDLFSGIGGFSLGLEAAGMQTVAFCEIEPYCRAVLRKHWPDVPIHEDIRTMPTDGLGTIDLVCGGFPCQPWSLAGKRAGAEDDRDLWPEMRRVIAAVGPRWVVGENVPSLDDPKFMGLDRVLSDLESIGYQTTTLEIPACAVDAPHRRSRLWIVADAEGISERAGLCTRGEGGKRRARFGDCGGAVADADATRLQGPREQQGKCRAGPDERGQLGRVSRWEPEPDVGRVATRVPNRVDRLRALGNAAVPQIVEVIGRAILEADKQTRSTS